MSILVLVAQLPLGSLKEMMWSIALLPTGKQVALTTP
jgi:hypothetical protein